MEEDVLLRVNIDVYLSELQGFLREYQQGNVNPYQKLNLYELFYVIHKHPKRHLFPPQDIESFLNVLRANEAYILANALEISSLSHKLFLAKKIILLAIFFIGREIPANYLFKKDVKGDAVKETWQNLASAMLYRRAVVLN
ncbi:MAG: hypothetical protein PHE89_08210 [Alphaproteobacteria bacterium]|nr:hypothetical protein [Alphaproteobacteria bacterium]